MFFCFLFLNLFSCFFIFSNKLIETILKYKIRQLTMSFNNSTILNYFSSPNAVRPQNFRLQIFSNDLKDSSINLFSSTVMSLTKSRGYLRFILQHASMPNIKLVLTLLQKKSFFIMKTQFIFRLYKIDHQLSHSIFRRVFVCEGV